MAGLGRRNFAAGEVLTAANVMGYLQDQAVMNFAGTAARGSAIASPSEGMVTYLADSNLIQVYDGSAWQSISSLSNNILQIVTGQTFTAVNNSTTTYVDTGLSATITPSSTSSKIVVMVFHNGVVKYDGAAASGLFFKIFRNATDIGLVDTYVGYTNTTTRNQTGSWAFTYKDSPSSTSALTYKTQFANGTNLTGVGVQNGSGLSTMVLVEIQ